MDQIGYDKKNLNAPAEMRETSQDWKTPETTPETNVTIHMELSRPVLIYDNK